MKQLAYGILNTDLDLKTHLLYTSAFVLFYVIDIDTVN
jgi:hypothetical protein